MTLVRYFVTTMGKATDIMCVCVFLTIDLSSSFLCSIGQLPFAFFLQFVHLNCVDLFLHLLIYLFNCMCMHTCHGMQRTTFGNLFSFFYLWVQRIEFRSSCLAASTFTCGFISPVLVCTFLLLFLSICFHI